MFLSWMSLFVIALFGFVALSWLQYFSFSIPAVDFSIFDQMIPNTARGNFMVSPACGGCDHFGVHSTPILFLFYPFHRWISHPLFFVTLHAVALWSAAIPLFLLCRLKLEKPWHRLGVLIAFFCSPFLIKILDYQFHPEVFYVPFFLWFVYFVETKRWKSLWVIAALILSVKEDGAIYLSAAALGAFATRRMSLKQALSLVALSLTVFILNIKWLIPSNSSLGEYHLAGTASKYGSTLGEAVWGMVRHSGEIMLDLIRGVWLKKLFHYLFIPLLEPYFLLAVAPFALIHSVADSNVMRGLSTYYSAPYLPWVFAGFVLALSRKGKLRLPKRVRDLAVVFAVLTSVPAWYPRHFPQVSDVTALNQSFKELSHHLETGRSVCAQSTIFPHLGYPEKIEVLGESCVARKLDYYIINTKLNHWPLSGGELDLLLHRLNEDRDYRSERFGDFVLFVKRSKSD